MIRLFQNFPWMISTLCLHILPPSQEYLLTKSPNFILFHNEAIIFKLQKSGQLLDDNKTIPKNLKIWLCSDCLDFCSSDIINLLHWSLFRMIFHAKLYLWNPNSKRLFRSSSWCKTEKKTFIYIHLLV